MCFVFCPVCFVFFPVCFSLCVLCFSLCVLCFALCVLCFFPCVFCVFPCVFCVFPCVFCVLLCVFCVFPCVFCVFHCVFCVFSCVFCVFSCVFCVFPRVFCVFSCVFCVFPCVLQKNYLQARKRKKQNDNHRNPCVQLYGFYFGFLGRMPYELLPTLVIAMFDNFTNVTFSRGVRTIQLFNTTIVRYVVIVQATVEFQVQAETPLNLRTRSPLHRYNGFCLFVSF